MNIKLIGGPKQNSRFKILAIPNEKARRSTLCSLKVTVRFTKQNRGEGKRGCCQYDRRVGMALKHIQYMYG
jgi:hypothetical protein